MTANVDTAHTGSIINGTYSGNWYGSSAGNRGLVGSYWSSSANNSVDAYTLRFTSSNVNPGTNSLHKYSGFSVRCVAGGSGS